MWSFKNPPWYLVAKSKVALDNKEDRKKREEACRFIEDIAKRLNFPYRTIATAQLYFHIFYTKHSFTQYPHMDIALTALLVASKAEETYKKIRQILSAAFLTLNPQFEGSELDVKIVEEHRQRVTQYEHLVLEAVDYNFSTIHAHELLAKVAQSVKSDEKISLQAFKFIQKTYHTPQVLCYPAEFVALAALIHAEGQDNKDRKRLASKMNIRYADLIEIANIIK